MAGNPFSVNYAVDEGGAKLRIETPAAAPQDRADSSDSPS